MEKKDILLVILAIVVSYFIMVLLNAVLQCSADSVFNVGDLFNGLLFTLCFGFGFPLYVGVFVLLVLAALMVYGIYLLIRKLVSYFEGRK